MQKLTLAIFHISLKTHILNDGNCLSPRVSRSYFECLDLELVCAPRPRYLCLFKTKGLSSNSFTLSIVCSCSIFKSIASAMHSSKGSLYLQT